MQGFWRRRVEGWRASCLSGRQNARGGDGCAYCAPAIGLRGGADGRLDAPAGTRLEGPADLALVPGRGARHALVYVEAHHRLRVEIPGHRDLLGSLIPDQGVPGPPADHAIDWTGVKAQLVEGALRLANEPGLRCRRRGGRARGALGASERQGDGARDEET